MNVFELAFFAVIAWLAVLTGSYTYETTDNLLVSSAAAYATMIALPLLLIIWSKLEDAKKREIVGSDPPIQGVTSSQGTADPKGKRRWQREELLPLVWSAVPVVIGQVTYAASRDRVAAWAATVGAVVLFCLVASGVMAARRQAAPDRLDADAALADGELNVAPDPTCPLCNSSRAVAAGQHPSWITSLPECHVLLGENQGCPGWCVLVLKEHVEHMAELSIPRQQRVFAEVARVAAAVRAVYPTSGKGGGPVRINYECLGNLVGHIHWHIIPRHADDPEPTKAVWGWPEERLKGAMTEQERERLMVELRERLGEGM